MVSRRLSAIARQRKGPLRRGQDGSWYTTIGRRNVKVADKECTYEQAFQEYAKVVSQPYEPPSKQTLGILFNAFLDWCQSNRAEATYEWYRRFCKSFVRFVGVSLKISDGKPYHVQDWLSREYKKATNNTRNGAVRALQRAFNCGVKNGRMRENLRKGMKATCEHDASCFWNHTLIECEAIGRLRWTCFRTTPAVFLRWRRHLLAANLFPRRGATTIQRQGSLA